MRADLDTAAKIIAENFSASVLRGLQEPRPRTFLFIWEQWSLDWLKEYRAAGGKEPFCHWTGSYMRLGPPPWRDKE